MSLFDKLNDIYKTSTKIIPIITPIRFYSTDTFYSTTIYSSAKLDYTTPVANEVYDILKIILMIAGVCLILSLIFFVCLCIYRMGWLRKKKELPKSTNQVMVPLSPRPPRPKLPPSRQAKKTISLYNAQIPLGEEFVVENLFNSN